VLVVGGGIAGLAAAAAVRRERPDAEVRVLEAADRAGGKLRLGEVGGVTVDVGAEAMLNRRPEAVALARAAGLGDSLVYPATTEARVWSRGALRRMPRTMMGIPVDLDDLAASEVLSAEGLARAAREPEVPLTDLGERDLSVGALVEQRFGPEVVDRLVEPLLGGVYAGHAREISLRAAIPQVVPLVGRGPFLGAGARPAPDSATPVFAGIRGGVGRLPDAVAAGLDVRTGTTVRELARTPQGGWRVVTGPAAAPREERADAVVLATPAAPTARLLADVVPAAATELAAIESASMAVVTLAFLAEAFPPVPGSGMLVPPVEGRFVKAATYSFAKWEWVRAASPGLVLLRTSVGRHREEHQLQAADEEIVTRSVADLADAVGVRVPPVDWHVQRWGGGLPQYAVGHLDRVRRIREAVAGSSGLAVCGAAYEGVGIAACIAGAEAAAAQVLAALDDRPLPRTGE
jgi:oxygen-dependent protoporphyrinogen oxidase